MRTTYQARRWMRRRAAQQRLWKDQRMARAVELLRRYALLLAIKEGRQP